MATTETDTSGTVVQAWLRTERWRGEGTTPQPVLCRTPRLTRRARKEFKTRAEKKAKAEKAAEMVSDDLALELDGLKTMEPGQQN